MPDCSNCGGLGYHANTINRAPCTICNGPVCVRCGLAKAVAGQDGEVEWVVTPATPPCDHTITDSGHSGPDSRHTGSSREATSDVG